MTPAPVDEILLHFNPESLAALNVVIASIMFGVALDIRLADFRDILKRPRAFGLGALSQFLLMPFLTFLLTLILDPGASIALGMILVAACPGGNVSNFLTHLAKGNTALSVGMTAFSTVLSVVMTPFNVAFWGKMNPKTAVLLREIKMDPSEIFVTIFIILGIPLAAGMLIENRLPRVAARLRKPMKTLSLLFLAAFVAVALKNNWDYFVAYIGLVLVAVFVENATALSLGYFAAKAIRLSEADARAISIENGIHNTALGLALIFAFFGGLGGAALVAAWWGIWHILSGGTLALIWSRFPPSQSHT